MGVFDNRESIEATIQTIKLGRLFVYGLPFCLPTNLHSSGKVNIDVAENLRLAEKLGVLDEGVPNIQLFASKKKRDTIMSGGQHCNSRTLFEVLNVLLQETW